LIILASLTWSLLLRVKGLTNLPGNLSIRTGASSWHVIP